jgi:hypothetical protein
MAEKDELKAAVEEVSLQCRQSQDDVWSAKAEAGALQIELHRRSTELLAVHTRVDALPVRIGLVHRRILFMLRMCHVYKMENFIFFHDNMVYWELLVAGKLEFTPFDPLVAEKHSGLQGLKWEGNSINHAENELNWIKSLTKSDIIGIRIGYWNRISESESDIRIGYHSDRAEISETDKISSALHREFLDSLYKVRVSVLPQRAGIWSFKPGDCGRIFSVLEHTTITESTEYHTVRNACRSTN